MQLLENRVVAFFLSKSQGGMVVKVQDQGDDPVKPWYVYWRDDRRPVKKYGKLAHIAALKELRKYWQG